MSTEPADLSDAFFVQFVATCSRLAIDPFDLIRVCFSESGCRANAHNPNGDASGIFQAMPATLMGLGFAFGDAAFRALDAADQVPWLERYMTPHASWCSSDALCYVAIFLPALGAKAQAEGPEFILCGQRGPLSWAYQANRVLDRDGNGSITVADLGAQLTAQCKGPRWDAIISRLRQELGVQPSTPPDIDTAPEVEVPHPLARMSVNVSATSGVTSVTVIRSPPT